MKEPYDDIRRYFDRKKRCPRCGGESFVDTEINILDIPTENYVDRKNITICKTCLWRGFIDELMA